MTKTRFFTIVTILLITAIGFAMPTQTLKVKADDNGAAKFTIVMNEYSFVVDGQKAGDPIQLKVNQLYDMTVQNVGKIPHEIWWGKNTQMQDGRLDGYSTNLFAGVDVAIFGTQAAGQDPFEIDAPGLTEIALTPGQTLTVEFTLPDTAKGAWEIGCFQPIPASTPEAPATADPVVPHYMAGMNAKLIVQ